jgi:hypothetical protein
MCEQEPIPELRIKRLPKLAKPRLPEHHRDKHKHPLAEPAIRPPLDQCKFLFKIRVEIILQGHSPLHVKGVVADVEEIDEMGA